MQLWELEHWRPTKLQKSVGARNNVPVEIENESKLGLTTESKMNPQQEIGFLSP